MPLADLVRRRLIASLLSRPHLILSGVPGIGKMRLARALAVSGVGGLEDRVCRLIGTYDADLPLALDGRTNQLVGQLHLGRRREYRLDQRDARNESPQNRLLTCR